MHLFSPSAKVIYCIFQTYPILVDGGGSGGGNGDGGSGPNWKTQDEWSAFAFRPRWLFNLERTISLSALSQQPLKNDPLQNISGTRSLWHKEGEKKSQNVRKHITSISKPRGVAGLSAIAFVVVVVVAIAFYIPFIFLYIDSVWWCAQCSTIEREKNQPSHVV